MSDIAERVKKIVIEHLGVDADKVTDSASFIDDLAQTAWTPSSWSWLSKKSSVRKFLMMQLKPSRRLATPCPS